ncbi:Uncharacterised protein [Zhongshania aliphaticivorans]|uniref:HigA2-like helix-turn-helix domain-containing protein n=1 Tax=Zhongshania aliphaticivorans TaxID=1470434 RepID=A0A5S9NHV1_9GAMM|nr:hypothetical protein [Zhongshania aliphaticivorans]CAA0089548.1 Uncharacterised protein [Zhongshania aliphaticivorans]CAA0096389.1 Uncharacterised protein [Zhongshania aliphaticivorans]
MYVDYDNFFDVVSRNSDESKDLERRASLIIYLRNQLVELDITTEDAAEKIQTQSICIEAILEGDINNLPLSLLEHIYKFFEADIR